MITTADATRVPMNARTMQKITSPVNGEVPWEIVSVIKSPSKLVLFYFLQGQRSIKGIRIENPGPSTPGGFVIPAGSG
jgi:hypothetical protein